MSVDGYIDDAGPDRLVLSNPSDLARVTAVRESVDAILVGANTVRRDNPRLVVRTNPIKVTITTSGDLDPGAQFFTLGPATKIVYTLGDPVKLAERLAGLAEVVPVTDLDGVLADLAARGVRRLMVEGGGTIHTQFLAQGLADELHLAVAPMFLGDPTAPRFVHKGQFPHPMALVSIQQLDDVAVLRYLLGSAALDWHRLREAVRLSFLCPASETAFSVGAVIVDSTGVELARGYSRESDPIEHAEEAALRKLSLDDPRLLTATLYSSMEPCSQRASRPLTCTQLILKAAIPRVVFALREPPNFVDGQGLRILDSSGVEVIEIPELAPAAREANRHLVP